ncbi:MAG: peptidoglycan DD-metalloendopeptidase family protein [Clostridia bacterium]|nr:peptidoglycan DD-metalloendopeptidase family protein [Clostridia bacterium]
MKKAKNLLKKPIALALTALLCFFGAGEFLLKANTIYAAKDGTVTSLEKQIKDIQTKKKDVLSRMTAAKNDKAKKVEYKKYIDEQINLTNDEIKMINDLIAEYNTKIETKETEIETASVNIDEQYENFKDILRLRYEEGDASYVEMILGSEDFYDFLVRMEQVTSLMDYCSDLLDSYKLNKMNLEGAKAELENSRTAQLAYQETVEERMEELEILLDDTEAYLLKLETTISSYDSSYKEYAAAEDKLDKELEAYLKELQAKENSAYVGGEFNWPLPVNWKNISSPYGTRTLYGVKEFHRGIDIPASKNTNIYASNGGKVITATYHYSYGNYVVIDHGGGKSTLYAHATKLNCKVGQYVKQGDVIAFVGTTGHSYGNHLHFEVRINGSAKNPLDYVVRP